MSQIPRVPSPSPATAVQTSKEKCTVSLGKCTWPVTFFSRTLGLASSKSTTSSTQRRNGHWDGRKGSIRIKTQKLGTRFGTRGPGSTATICYNYQLIINLIQFILRTGPSMVCGCECERLVKLKEESPKRS